MLFQERVTKWHNKTCNRLDLEWGCKWFRGGILPGGKKRRFCRRKSEPVQS